MKALALVSLLTALAALAVGTPAVRAEQPASPAELELRHARRLTVVHPGISTETAATDAEQAIAQIEARARQDTLVRGSLPGFPRRPDLGYDVVSGIQQRTTGNAIRAR